MEIIKHAKNPVRFVVRTVATRVEVPKAVSTPTGEIALNNQVRKAKANTLAKANTQVRKAKAHLFEEKGAVFYSVTSVPYLRSL